MTPNAATATPQAACLPSPRASPLRSSRRRLSSPSPSCQPQPAQALTGVDLATYKRVGRFDLPEPTPHAAAADSLLAQEASGVTYDWDTDTPLRRRRRRHLGRPGRQDRRS